MVDKHSHPKHNFSDPTATTSTLSQVTSGKTKAELSENGKLLDRLVISPEYF
jgi:hypothetical protein